MKRRVFLQKSGTSLFLLNALPNFNWLPSFIFEPSKKIKKEDLSSIDESLRQGFNGLLDWLKKNGWASYFQEKLNVDISNSPGDLQLCELLPNINKIGAIPGFDDFGGNKLIEPGNPSFSLLYHALASPRVKDPSIKAYPTIECLDVLENFIYGLEKFDNEFYKEAKRNIHLAVLAYEYRPAYKTPTLDPNNITFKKFAQLVFSRTGIARVGNKEENFDAVNRSFINLPKEKGMEKQIAVTPARYGLFLVELVEVKQRGSDDIKVMNYQDIESTNIGPRGFIKPIRKIFTTKGINIQFAEYHLNEKLFRLSQFKLEDEGLKFNIKLDNSNLSSVPFKRVSCTNDKGEIIEKYHTNDVQMVKLLRFGASVLLTSIPDKLIKVAKLKDEIISFEVPKKWKKAFLSNRRYSAFKVTDKRTKDVYDGIWTDFIYRRNRRTSRFRAPRNAPLFVNIKFKNGIDTNSGDNLANHLNASTTDLEGIINRGGYNAQLFEDNICDGCISAKININQDEHSDLNLYLIQHKETILPAFSIVAAPDFFPYIDSNDIRAYYMGESLKMDQHFLEGGTINLSGIRQRGNPKIKDPFKNCQAFFNNSNDDRSFDTLTAVVSNNYQSLLAIDPEVEKKSRYNYKRDFKITSFLPDTGTGVYYPGWEVTYSGNTNNPFLGTFGLGSPFPEDMKLCAAANGMWPVSSPDAGRTFQGSLEKFPGLGKPNTSIPLMDDEIGLHPNSPHVTLYKQKQSYGWDGEQGPYLQFDPKDSKKLVVNFTDIGRADYVYNLLEDSIGFDMSKIRELDCGELISRMDCLRNAINSVSTDRRKRRRFVEYSNYWLVSSEKVINWHLGPNAYGIASNLIGNDNSWVKGSSGLSGGGYLFVFAITKEKCIIEELENPKSKRRNQEVSKICICKVSKADSKVIWCELKGEYPKTTNEVQWKS